MNAETKLITCSTKRQAQEKYFNYAFLIKKVYIKITLKGGILQKSFAVCLVEHFVTFYVCIS